MQAKLKSLEKILGGSIEKHSCLIFFKHFLRVGVDEVDVLVE
jgi:hypothetical protein